MVSSLAWRQSAFLSESGPRPRRVWGLAGSQSGMLSLFLCGELVPHSSGKVSETSCLYSAVTHHTCYPLHGPGSFNLDLIGLSLLFRREVQHYLSQSVTHPMVAGSLRVKWIDDTALLWAHSRNNNALLYT